MNLLLIDLHQAGGHHMAHLRAICQEARHRNWNIHLALTAEAQQHPSFSTIAPSIEANCQVSTIPARSYSPQLKRLRWIGQQLDSYIAIRKGFRKALQSISPDAVYVIDCDSWYPCSAIFGPPFRNVRFATMTFSVRHHRVLENDKAIGLSTKSAKIQRLSFERFLQFPELSCVLTPDDTLSSYYAEQKSNRVRFIPDIADLPSLKEKRASKLQLGIERNKRVILSFGSISLRKGIRELVFFLNDVSCPPDVIALIAGEADTESAQFLESELVQDLVKKGRLFWMRGFLDDKSTMLAFSCADIAWICYQNFYNSSGFLWQAALAGLPVIGCAEGLIGRAIQEHKLGVVLPTPDTANILEAISNITKNYAGISANARTEGSKHSTVCFGNIICDALQYC